MLVCFVLIVAGAMMSTACHVSAWEQPGSRQDRPDYQPRPIDAVALPVALAVMVGVWVFLWAAPAAVPALAKIAAVVVGAGAGFVVSIFVLAPPLSSLKTAALAVFDAGLIGSAFWWLYTFS